MIVMQARILRSVDRYFGTFLYFLLWVLSPVLRNDAKGDNVLVIKLWAIGESILVLPSIKAITDKGFSVTVICTKQNKFVFEKQRFVDEIIVFGFSNPLKALAQLISLRTRGFSVSIDSDPYMKFSSVIGVLSGASRRYGFDNRRLLYTDPVRINEDQHAVLVFRGVFSRLSDFPAPKSLVPVAAEPVKISLSQKSIALHAGSATTSTTRRWPEENFASLCDYFSSKGWTTYLVGSAGEKRINSDILKLCKTKDKVIDTSGSLSLGQLAHLFSRMKLVIANDSGPMHIAAAMGTPTIGLFGPNLPERFGPYGPRCIGLRNDAKPPCILPFRARFPECRHDHMKNLSVAEVLKAANRLAGI